MNSISHLPRRPGYALVAVLSLLFTAPSVFAEDLHPPDWRSTDLSKWVEWERDVATGDWVLVDSKANDTPENPLYAPLDEAHVEATDEGYIFWAPNIIDRMPYKWVRVQMHWEGDEPPEVADVHGFDSHFDRETTVVSSERFFSEVMDGFTYEDWVIEPNPDWEYVYIEVPPDTTLHQVVIDTKSVPEPGSLALLGLGGLLLLKRRRG